MRLLIRLFTASATAQDALLAEAAACDALRMVIGTVGGAGPRPVTPAQAPERYWKIPALFEHALWLVPARLEDVRSLMAIAPAGWSPATVEGGLLQLEHDEDASWVWHPEAQASPFLLPAVAWAELLYQHDA